LGLFATLFLDPVLPPDPMAGSAAGPPLVNGMVVWSVTAAATVFGLAMGCLVSWYTVRRRKRERVAEQWVDHVISSARQAAANAAAPDVGRRLAWLSYHIGRLRQHRAVREGWLPGVDGASLDRLHFTLASELLGTVDLRSAVAAAADRPSLAAQVAVRRAELAAADAAFDAQLERLVAMSASANRIVELLVDVELAERLDAGGPTALQLRSQLTSAPVIDLDAMVVAADEVVRTVSEALDPQRLYAPGPAEVRDEAVNP
jgi:hypothetical protein